jgi:hypothetical protein
MAYTITDYPNLRTKLLGDDKGLWQMLKADLFHIIDSPSHFKYAEKPELARGPGLALMMVAVGGLETMATLANIGGLPQTNATEMVKRFADRYFATVNPRYNRGSGESLPTLIWDAYRNGGLHKFFPKQDTISVASGQVHVIFAVSWPETGGPANRSMSLDEVRLWRVKTLGQGNSGMRHLDVEALAPPLVKFWVNSPVFALELAEAVGKWETDMVGDANLQQWFVAGADRLEDGLKLDNPPGSHACLRSMVNAALVSGP